MANIIRLAPPLLALALLAGAGPAGGQTDPLPAGAGRELVAARCTSCHTVERIVNAGHDRAQWANIVAMMRNLGAQLDDTEAASVTEYLAKAFPARTDRAAVVVPGAVRVAFHEWLVPTPGARPHDPLAARDGSIWYTGQVANTLGRLDPATGAIREYRPPTAQSGPHGLVEDRDGNTWFTANYAAYIGKLDPRTGRFTEYHLDPAARDPHTPIFTPDGRLWFTVQGANMIGRLDPTTGRTKLVTVPTAHALPYGMVVDSHGTPWFAEFGANKLGAIDPQTMAIREVTLPDAAARPRRIAIDGNDVLWYTDYARGYLGRYDPRSRATAEWPSPGGRRSQPYGITYDRGAVWYSESGVTPNTLVRFDPASSRFQTWPIPSGGGVVRNMMPTKDGNLALACSGVNRIALVEVR